MSIRNSFAPNAASKFKQPEPYKGEYLTNELAVVEGYGKDHIVATLKSTGEEVKIRLADADDMVKYFGNNQNKTAEENRLAALRTIENRAKILDYQNPRSLHIMPEGGTIRIDRAVKTDDVVVARWLSGIANDPDRELVLEGNASVRIIETENSAKRSRNSAPDKDPDYNRSYNLRLVQDHRAVPIEPNNHAANHILLEKFVAPYVKDDGGTVLDDQPSLYTGALVVVKAADQSVTSYTLSLPRVENEEGKFVPDPNGLRAIFENTAKEKLSAGTDSDAARLVIVVALHAATKSDVELQFSDEQSKAFANEFKSGFLEGKHLVAAAPQYSMNMLKTLKTKVTNLPIADKNAGKMNGYANRGYFPASICLRTVTNDGQAMDTAAAKDLIYNVRPPAEGDRATWDKSLASAIATRILTTPEGPEANKEQAVDYGQSAKPAPTPEEDQIPYDDFGPSM